MAEGAPGPTVALGEGALSYARGTPVTALHATLLQVAEWRKVRSELVHQADDLFGDVRAPIREIAREREREIVSCVFVCV